MAKRFTDTEKWRDEWWGSLNNDYRMIWLYLVDSCSFAGLWKKDFRGLNFNCNTNIQEEEFFKVFGDRVINKGAFFFIPKFILFQYPKGLGSKMPAIVSVVKELNKHGLLETVNKLFYNSSVTIKDKDKEKDKDITVDYETKKGEEKNEVKDSSVIFTIGINKFYVKPSEHIQSDYRKSMETFLMSHDLSRRKAEVLKKFDEQYPVYHFREPNHFTNSFRVVCEIVKKQPVVPVKATSVKFNNERKT